MTKNQNKQELAFSLAYNIYRWPILNMIRFAEEKLADTGADYSGGVYSWTYQQLGQYCYDKYAEELAELDTEVLVILKTQRSN